MAKAPKFSRLFFLPCFAAFFLAACATPRPPAPPAAALAQSFHLEARAGGMYAEEGKPPKPFAGSLSWSHAPSGDKLVVAGPFGFGSRELTKAPDGKATLAYPNGKVKHVDDVDEALRRLFKVPLPFASLVAWVQARPAPETVKARDAAGRPTLAIQDGWRIEWRYEGESALPVQIDILRGPDFSLRLVVASWQAQP
jgi:outer membrane lipoprotein LolB